MSARRADWQLPVPRIVRLGVEPTEWAYRSSPQESPTNHWQPDRQRSSAAQEGTYRETQHGADRTAWLLGCWSAAASPFGSLGS